MHNVLSFNVIETSLQVKWERGLFLCNKPSWEMMLLVRLVGASQLDCIALKGMIMDYIQDISNTYMI